MVQEEKKKNTTKINGLNKANRVASFPLSIVWELNLLAKMHWNCELWLLMWSRSSMYSPLGFHWLRNKGVQVSVCFFTKYRVSEDSRAGERLRLILVLKETKWVWTSWKFNNHSDWRVLLWEWRVFHGSLRCNMIASKGREGLNKSMMAAPHLCQFD